MWNFSQFIASKDKDFWGWFLLIFGSVFFVGFFYAAIILKFLPPSDNALISAIQTDRLKTGGTETHDKRERERERGRQIEGEDMATQIEGRSVELTSLYGRSEGRSKARD
ncbi:hypothetical protein CsSME_00040059 [Camellia sinensis var. sinensis]